MAGRRILLRACQTESKTRMDTGSKVIGFGRFLNVTRRGMSSRAGLEKPQFGFIFDIDGVIVRGKQLLPRAREAFRRLTDIELRFRVPVLFVTNAGSTLREKKAEQLSEWLRIPVNTEQVVMSHSPLKMFGHLHDKRALISGQGPVEEIARALGFTSTVTVEQLRGMFPHLDMVEHRQVKTAPCAFEEYFPPVEVVILFGEPVRWETSLQLILDVLVTNGKPCREPHEIPYPHLPVLACNMDLAWMAEACMPRFGHGCFLHCLESVYQKTTGHQLKYTALLGKPAEVTYHYANLLLRRQARQMGLDGIRRIYCVGDNLETDIYGSNLYNRHLAGRFQSSHPAQRMVVKSQGVPYFTGSGDEDMEEGCKRNLHKNCTAESCISILVCTGVHTKGVDCVHHARAKRSPNHNHRDFAIDPELREPDFVLPHVLDAVQFVLQRENFK